jgi:cell wall-associated NlpC family hydrolase
VSVADVTSRIGEIRSQLGLLAPAPVDVLATATRTTAAGSSSAVDFASALANSGYQATGAGGVGSVDRAGDLPGTAPGGSTAEQRVVDEAKKYLGVPYLWGGTDPDKGLDCSGLVQLVYRNNGIELPRVSYQQATAGRPVASMAEARPGDILAFNSPVDHVGIYLGNGKMLEAPRTGLNVRIIDVPETPTAIRRVLPPSAAAEASAAAGAARVSAAGSGTLPAGTPYASLFEAAGTKYGVDPTLLAAVAKQESAFNPRAVSHAGAQGLMQLMPATAAGLGVRNSFDPAQAVDGAARLLRDLSQQFGRTDLALAAYNAGPGAVNRYNGIPPYAETQKYVPAVLAHKSALEQA